MINFAFGVKSVNTKLVTDGIIGVELWTQQLSKSVNQALLDSGVLVNSTDARLETDE